MARAIVLNTGAKMPTVGLGCWQSSQAEIQQSVESALDCGYRCIDTAWAYQNEEGVGAGIRKKIDEGKLKREELFLITKIAGQFHGRSGVMEGIKDSLSKLKLDYVDLLLVHFPIAMEKCVDQAFPVDEKGNFKWKKADHIDTWKGMEDAVDAGLARSIGLSNFNSKQIQNIWDNCKIKPANLQVECHAYFNQEPLFQFCQKLGISFTAYSPIGSPGLQNFSLTNQNRKVPKLLEDPLVCDLAKKHKRTPAQILLRFLLQRGMTVLPKSVNPDRIKQNFDLWNFELQPDDMEKLMSLPQTRMVTFIVGNSRECPDFPFHEPF